MALRYWLLPNIEHYHDSITSSLSAAMGNPVTIGKIQGEWQGFMPRLKLTDVRILDDQRQTALALKSIDGSLSWMSLFTAEIRLASLEIDSPELLIRRDASGKLYIGNLALSKPGENNDISDWLLHQSNLVVRNALIVWMDAQRAAPPLVLKQVNLRVSSWFNQHRFALQAMPPKDLATPLDLRGEFYGESFDSLSKWRGKLFTRLDYTNVTAWRPWLDLPGEFSQGRGALRGWLDINDGKITQVTVDMNLRDVVTKLGADVPEMQVSKLHGRASWQGVTGGFTIATKNLAMQLQDGLDFQPTNFYFRTVNTGDHTAVGGQTSSVEIRANLLRLKNLDALAKYLPMQTALRARLNAYAPKGVVSDLDAQWQGVPENPDNYKLKGHFENLGLNQVGKIPGFSGLTGDVNGSEASGRLSIDARGMTVNAPGVMREPLSFETLIGQASWQRKNGELSINVDNIAVSNDDLAGNLYGSYRTQAGTLGVLDLTGRLTRGDIRRAARYTPLIALGSAGNDWLNGALLAGHTEDFRIHIKGNLSNFPPDGRKDVLLEIGGHAQDAVLKFDKNWPRIEHISGELLIHNNKLVVESPSATILDTHLHNVTITIPDMMSKDQTLQIKGEATGTSNSFLEFVQKSPVRGYIEGFTDGISASGDGQLDLSANIPLSGDKPVKVSGTIKVQGNDIDLGKDVPMLRKTRGTLAFTQAGMHANNVTAEILGGAASINVQSSENGAVNATVKGRSNVGVLRKLEPYPVLDYLHGSTDWDVDINVINKSAQIVLTSRLQGLSSALPQPFTKSAGESMLLRAELTPLMNVAKPVKPCVGSCPKTQSAGQEKDVITARLGNLFSARLERQQEGGSMVIKRGLVRFGQPGKLVSSIPAHRLSRGRRDKLEGVWLVGNLSELSVEGWGGLIGAAQETAAKKGSGVAMKQSGNPQKSAVKIAEYGPKSIIAGANLHIEKLTGFGQSISAVHVTATRRGDGLAAMLSGVGLNGEMVWEPHGYNNGNLFRAHLSRLQLASTKQSSSLATNSAEPVKPSLPVKSKQEYKSSPGNVPALDISIENLQLKGKHIGRFELIGHPEGKDWLMRRLNITNPDGSLVGNGVWSDAQGQQETQLKLLLDIRNAGKVLDRSGYPSTVKGGDGRLEADISWAGSPDKFSYATLNGSLKLDTGKGRFLKMDPGAGKLLSVLSLQDLPRHIALGFTDVFSEGFQFDSINGNAAIKDGVIDTQDFHIDGSSAKVTLKGSVNLNRETQDMQVRVMPTIGNSMAVIGAFVFSPVVGIGSLIVNKVLGNPLDKLASFDYNVSGSWRDPDVVRVGEFAKEPKQDN